jgi:hypothetical protein
LAGKVRLWTMTQILLIADTIMIAVILILILMRRG